MENTFKKSSFCSGGQCVKVVMDANPSYIFVYDEQNNVVWYSHQEWNDFIKGVKNGEFDIKE